MPSVFRPPGCASLADVDNAEGIAYEDQPRIVEGIISPRAQATVHWPEQEYETHSFSFASWRFPGEAVTGCDLTLLRAIPLRHERGEYDDTLTQFPSYSVQRFSVLLAQDHTRAVIDEILVPSPDAEDLQPLAEELKKPVRISTSLFGDVVLDPSVGWFVGNAIWRGTDVDVFVDPDETGSITDAIEIAEGLWKKQPEWTRRIEDYAVEKLLALKNEAWLEEEESSVSAGEFKNRMTLESITVSSEGFEFCYDDGDLFWGHQIAVAGTLDEGPTDADI